MPTSIIQSIRDHVLQPQLFSFELRTHASDRCDPPLYCCIVPVWTVQRAPSVAACRLNGQQRVKLANMSKTSQDLHTVNNFIENSFVKAASKGNTRAMLTSDYLSWESAARRAAPCTPSCVLLLPTLACFLNPQARVVLVGRHWSPHSARRFPPSCSLALAPHECASRDQGLRPTRGAVLR